MNSISFAQMLASRLCHDLITPIGAVNTGLELLDDCSEEDRVQLMALSLQSAQTASRRLVYYRAAFGYSAATFLSSLDTLNLLITDFLKPQKIQLSWSQKPASIELLIQKGTVAAFSRIILNLILLTSETAPVGGEMKLRMDLNDEGWDFEIDLTGKLVQMRPEIRAALQNELEERLYSAQTIQAVMTQVLLSDNNTIIENFASSKEALSLHISHKFEHQSINGMLF